MASGSYARKDKVQEKSTQPILVPRATKMLPAAVAGEEQKTEPLHTAKWPGKVVEEFAQHALQRHRPWLTSWVVCTVLAVIGTLVLISAAYMQRTSDNPQLLPFSDGHTYSIQVGGSLNIINTWENSSGPLPSKTPIPTHTGPYSVLGTPTITVDFINRVLASYHSPAAGKGQALYNLGQKYGIDPVYALAFFMHESTLGTQGEARVTLSLGNIRCVPNQPCRDGYSQYSSWENGFEAWYKLIRNLYVAQWGLITVDRIIPTYAPSSDNNNEQGYIAALKHYINTWHAGIIRP